jgi:hypothetical protein
MYQHTTDFFEKLAQHNLSNPIKGDLHILCGDFSSHVSLSIEAHLTREDRKISPLDKETLTNITTLPHPTHEPHM